MIHPLNRRPFISIAGLRNRADMLAIINDLPPTKTHVFSLGFLASQATIEGRAPREHVARFPTVQEIKSMLPTGASDTRVIYMLHYVAGGAPGQNEAGIEKQMHRAFGLLSPGLNGIRLSTVDPAPREIGLFVRLTHYPPDLRVVLQVRPQHLQSMGVEALLGHHVHFSHVSDVTLDFGGDFDVAVAGKMLADIKALFGNKVGLGLAGGLTPHNLQALKPLVAEIGPFSLEVEGGVRKADDKFDAKAAVDFLHRSVALFA